MGKKSKTGKSRRDKFYHLAKETGFRSRAAFKLLQLNSKYEFLQKSRVCVDLCAAPGGWMQVATQQMPMASLVIGIDLVPIRPIHGTTALQCDITTEKCRQDLKKELQTWEVDVFLNDGAPNVGQSWVYDAFKQAELTLAALKLAVQFLKKGGWFVTKVFRSKDYNSLMWVFKQLFRKVFATKPQASRNESAEIFVVCQYFIKPDKLDPKFLNPKFVFKDVETDPKSALNILYPHKERKKAEGYADNDMTLHTRLKASIFLEASNHIELMGQAHEIVLDVPEVAEHPLTTAEIKHCLQDIKVLGKKDINAILKWRKKMVNFLEQLKKEQAASNEEDKEEEELGEGEDEEEVEEKALDEKIATIQEEEDKLKKKKRRKVMREKTKLRDKINLNMIIPGDNIEMTDDIDLFNLKRIKSKKHVEDLEKRDMSDNESEDEKEIAEKYPSKFTYAKDVKYYNDEDDAIKEANDDYEDVGEYDDDDDEEEMEMEEVTDKDTNPLVIELEPKDLKTKRSTDRWFSKDAFSGITDEGEEDFEIDQVTLDYVKKGGEVIGKKDLSKKRKLEVEEFDTGNASDSDDGEEDNENDADSYADSDAGSDEDKDSDDSDDDDRPERITQVIQEKGTVSSKAQVAKDGFEIVPKSKVVKLDPLELAIGEEMIKSSKKRREFIEMSYNRFTNNDDHLPDWFAEDEKKHRRKFIPLSKDQIDAYKLKAKEINVKTIKKVAEAKARKKRKMAKKLEKARKKSENITDAVDVTEKEKWHKIKQIYQKAGLLGEKKPEVTYVVAKKGAGKKVRRPAGVKGRFKVVDPRMKKDMKSMKAKEKTKGRKKPKGRAR